VSISRKTQAPVSITNTSGQPEIVLEIDGLVLSMKPPVAAPAPESDDESEPEPG
jgi:hypothetical protein